jgi:hypothetical protein
LLASPMAALGEDLKAVPWLQLRGQGYADDTLATILEDAPILARSAGVTNMVTISITAETNRASQDACLREPRFVRRACVVGSRIFEKRGMALSFRVRVEESLGASLCVLGGLVVVESAMTEHLICPAIAKACATPG